MSNAIDQFVSVSSNPYGGTQDANELIVRALAFEQSWYDDQGKRVQPDRNAALGVSGLHSQLQSSLHIGLSTPSDSSVNIKDLLLNAQALYRTEEFDLYLAENSGMEEVFVVDHKHPQKRWQVIRTSNLHGLSQLLNILPLGLIQMNNLWQANFVNAQATALTGLQTDELQDRGWMSLFSSEQLSEVRRHFAADFDYVDSFTLTLSYKSPLGRHRVFKAVFSVQGFASHAVRNYVLLLVDVTSEEMVSEQLRHVALHDGMTGLMNRVAFIEHLHAMPVEQLEKGLMVFLDVNNFKFINDHHGHTAGDETLKIIGRRLRKAMRPGDLLSRFGGDEFVLFFEGVESQINASIIAHKLDYIANGPVGIADLQIEVTVSAGFALGSAIPFNSIENTSSESLVEAMLSAADSAMYRAKNNSSAGFFIFDQSLEQERKRRDEQLIELNRLTAESAFDYWFQPIVQDNQLVSVEVLARPQGMVSHLNVLEFFDTARRSRYKSRLFEDLTWGGLQKYQLLRDQWLEFGISSPVPKLNINMDMLQLD
ncbi:MAG: diguanylate cyclase domain-containing protein, partial [Oceanobacter sp.]